MDRPIVACIQHRLIVPESLDDYSIYLARFLRTAKAKGAVLALFPELSGIPAVMPGFTGWRNTLAISANQSKHHKLGFWQRTKAKMAGGAASVVKADLGKTFTQAMREMPESLHDSYVSTFSGLARQFEMTLVAGSIYDLDPATKELQNTCLVFGPDGSLLGRQGKVVLAAGDSSLAAGADGWGVIPTPAGNLGILLGNDVLYPEPGRILAYQGADILLALAAVTRPATYHKIFQAALARCQENQLFGMVSFLIGPDPFAAPDAAPYVGKSAIFAPLEFTPRFTGIMVQVGSPMAEGVITAEFDYPALNELWEESDTPLRSDMPMAQIAPILANVYQRGLPLADSGQLMLAAPAESVESSAEPIASSEAASESTTPAIVADEGVDYAMVSSMFPVTQMAPVDDDEPESLDEMLTAPEVSTLLDPALLPTDNPPVVIANDEVSGVVGEAIETMETMDVEVDLPEPSVPDTEEDPSPMVVDELKPAPPRLRFPWQNREKS